MDQPLFNEAGNRRIELVGILHHQTDRGLGVELVDRPQDCWKGLGRHPVEHDQRHVDETAVQQIVRIGKADDVVPLKPRADRLHQALGKQIDLGKHDNLFFLR
ncbi:hypothetical protein D9M72_341270 [compost metagenome]